MVVPQLARNLLFDQNDTIFKPQSLLRMSEQTLISEHYFYIDIISGCIISAV